MADPAAALAVPRRRQRATSARAAGIALTACEACRRKKTRCIAAEGESCKACSAGGITCTFPQPDATRQRTVRGLLARIEELEIQLQATQLRATNLPDHFAYTGTSHEFAVNGNVGQIFAHHSGAAPDGIEQHRSTARTRGEDAMIQHERLSGENATINFRSVTDRLSIEEDGNIRAYGPLSDHVLATVSPGLNDEVNDATASGPQQTTDPPQYATSEPDRQRLLAAAAANIDSMPMGTDIRLIEQLLLAFFLWHHNIFPVLSRRIFLEHFCKLGKYCSPFLLNAMLALASHFMQDSSVSSGGNLSGEPFFQRAKDYLEEELQHPTIVTVQGLAIMAEREAFAGRRIRAGLYFAMCGRLVSELGLHLDATPLLHRGMITAEDNYLRARTFWGIWAADKQFSSVLGQPCSIRLPHIACKLPGYWDQEDFDWWASLDSGRFVPVPGSSRDRGSLQISDFVRDMAFIYLHGMEHIYWKGSTLEGLNGNAHDILDTNMQRTRQAIQALPPLSNHHGGKDLPGLLMVYLIYHHHIIMMNRPFIVDSGRYDPQDSPRTRCRTSASSIVHLLAMFREATSYGLRSALNNIQHGLILAAGVLIVEMRLITSAEDKQTVLSELLQVLAFLEELSSCRPAAAKALHHLRTLAVAHDRQEAVMETNAVPSGSESSQFAGILNVPPERTEPLSGQLWESVPPSELDPPLTASIFDALNDPNSTLWKAQDFLNTDIFGLGGTQDPSLSLLLDVGDIGSYH